jgi:predicted transcriptional regulator
MKKLIVSLKSSHDVLGDFSKALKSASKKSKPSKSHYEISFDNKVDFNRFIRNIDILSYILQCKPQSTYELAKLCKKDISNLNKVIIFFEGIGVIHIERRTVSGRTVHVPMVDYDSIQFKLAA